MNTLAPAWQPDLPVSDEVDQAMRQLASDIMNDSVAAELQIESESEAMLPWFLIEQAY